MSSSLSENLATQRVAMNANSAKRQKVMDAVLALAQQTPPDSPTATLLSAPLASAPGQGIQAAAAPSSGGFNPAFNTSLQKLLNDYKGKVSISSGYRSPEKQAQLFANAVKKYGSEAAARKWVAPPGHSKHNEGLAADLHFSDNATKNTIHEVAAKYGLVFPMSWENWHIEPIGARK
jgi:hypothetical protein